MISGECLNRLIFLAHDLRICDLRVTQVELSSRQTTSFCSGLRSRPAPDVWTLSSGGWIHQAMPLCIRLIRSDIEAKTPVNMTGDPMLTEINGKMCSVRGFCSLQFSLLYDNRISSGWGLFYRKHLPDRMCCYHFPRLCPLESTSILFHSLSIAVIYRNNKLFVDGCIIANILIFVNIIS